MGCTSSSYSSESKEQIRGDVRSKKGLKRESSFQEIIEAVTPEEAEEAEIKNLLRIEKELQIELRMKALPIIERQLMCELMTQEQLSEQQKEDMTQLKAEKIEKRRQALTSAAQEDKWMIFNNADLFDDTDIQELSQFMDKLLKKVPTVFWNEQRSQVYAEELDRITASRENSKDSLITLSRENSRELISLSRENSAEKLLRIEKIKVRTEQGKGIDGELFDFRIPSGLITEKVCKKVIDVYKRGGKLNTLSVQKILRLAYRKLKELPNTTKLKISSDQRLTVVGDIHGQLEDLLHIIDEAGLPSNKNLYIFNGDFVDRGPQGVEVMCVLLSLYAAMPDCVVLNRGNHEDFAICCAYGFQTECTDKYGEVVFGMFCELFRHLPLFAVLNDDVLIVHGGLFHQENITLAELNEIDRKEFSLRDVDEKKDSKNRSDYLNKLQRDALWSDPQQDEGIGESTRGAGITFGPDVVSNFLKKNKLKMMVRSHECVSNGFDMPFSGTTYGSGDKAPMFCTIFSASNYSGGNDGAYIQFFTETASAYFTQVVGSKLKFIVYRYNIDSKQEQRQKGANSSISQSDTPTNLYAMILRKKPILLRAFEAADVSSEGYVSQESWAVIMEAITKLKIRWSAMVPALVPKKAIRENGDIDFYKYLGSVSNSETAVGQADGGISLESDFAIEAIYAQHKTLDTVFRFFDRDDKGYITRENFQMGCEVLNKHLPSGQQINNSDAILSLMDISDSGRVSINEFFEIFRIIESIMSRPRSLTTSAVSSSPHQPMDDVLVLGNITINYGDRQSFNKSVQLLIPDADAAMVHVTLNEGPGFL